MYTRSPGCTSVLTVWVREGLQHTGHELRVLADSDRTKISRQNTFTTILGTCAFARMSFRLKNTQAVYQRVIEMILISVKWKFALVYLDDIIVFLSSFEDHKSHLRTVLELLEATGVTLHLSKLKLFHTEVEILGHVINTCTFEIAPNMISSIQEATPHHIVRGVSSFFEPCNVCHRFLKRLSRIKVPLNDLLHNGQSQR